MRGFYIFEGETRLLSSYIYYNLFFVLSIFREVLSQHLVDLVLLFKTTLFCQMSMVFQFCFKVSIFMFSLMSILCLSLMNVFIKLLSYAVLSYTDAGGNQASGNSLCDGIFARNKCVGLPIVQPNRTLSPIAPTQSPTSPKPTAVPTFSPTFYRAKCERVNPAMQPCVDVLNWSDFRDKVGGGNETIVFCPFNITKGRRQPVVYITSSIRLVCAVPKQCRLNSGTRHVMVNAWLGAQVYIQGFVFQGASNSSVRFVRNFYDTKPHSLCNCAFFGNKATNRGAALWIEEGNKVTVSNSLFVGNLGTSVGGAIYNGGQLDLVESTFAENYGPVRIQIENK